MSNDSHEPEWSMHLGRGTVVDRSARISVTYPCGHKVTRSFRHVANRRVHTEVKALALRGCSKCRSRKGKR